MTVPAIRMKRQPSVLVVDDDPRGRRLLEGYLAQEGYDVRNAVDGPDALRLVRENPPDVILLDIMMPGMTGYEVCQAIKYNPATRLTQVMMVTALDATADRVTGLDTGADDYLAKPVRREEFLAKVRALLRARSLLEELEEARSELEARNRELELKKTLAQTLVHDLKNPLTAALGNLGLLALRVGEDRRYLVDRARSSLKRLQAMVHDLLDVECLEQDGYAPILVNTNLSGLARSAADEIEAQAARRNVQIRVDIRSEPCLVEGDASLLRRVVDNLLANALGHSSAGNTVTLAVSTRPEGVEFSVSDQGNGVPVGYRERIFEKYSRLDPREAGATVNRGLGLTFARLAVEAHGGSIWVEDAPGGGALFRAVLPAYEPDTARGAADGRATALTPVK